MLKTRIKSVSVLVGAILGAGIFALPYSLSSAGIFWNVVNFIVAFCVLLYIGYLYGEVAFFTKGRHRFTGYAELMIGRNAKPFALLTTVFSFYGALLIYSVLGGIFLENIFNTHQASYYVYLFFIVGGLLAYLRLNKLSAVNFYLVMPFFGFILYLVFAAWPHFNLANVFSNPSIFLNEKWLAPFGVWFFALSGTSSIPEARDLIYSARVNLKYFKKSILLSLATSAIFMFIFAFVIYGVSGLGTSQDAFSGIKDILGGRMILFGSVMGFLLVFNSFLVLSQDLKHIFRFDYSFSTLSAWLLAVVPPIVFYSFGLHDFTKTLGLIGTLGLGSSGLLIILMAKGLRKKIDARDTAVIETTPEPGDLIKLNKFTELAIMLLVVVAVAYELKNLLN